jgi:hypothetical protein
MTLKRALRVVTSLILKGRWRDARIISAPLVLACFFSLTGLSDDVSVRSTRSDARGGDTATA